MDITAIIKERGLTRAQVCIMAGISRPMLSMIERGRRRAGLDTARSLADALGTDVIKIRPDLADVVAPPKEDGK